MAPSTASPGKLNEEADELDRRAKELREGLDLGGSRKFMVAEGTAMSMSQDMQTLSSRQRRSRSRPSAGLDRTP